MVKELLSEKRFCETLLPRIPVLTQRDIDAKLADLVPKNLPSNKNNNNNNNNDSKNNYKDYAQTDN